MPRAEKYFWARCIDMRFEMHWLQFTPNVGIPWQWSYSYCKYFIQLNKACHGFGIFMKMACRLFNSDYSTSQKKFAFLAAAGRRRKVPESVSVCRRGFPALCSPLSMARHLCEPTGTKGATYRYRQVRPLWPGPSKSFSQDRLRCSWQRIATFIRWSPHSI